MKTSESQKSLAAALLAAQEEFPAIAKTKEGQSGNRKFKYADLDMIKDKVDPILWKRKLLLAQGTDGFEIVTRLDHIESGEWREIRMPTNKEHASDQAYGIELGYRRRYSVQLILGIVTEEDNDTDKHFKHSPMDEFRQQFKELDDEDTHHLMWLKFRINRRMVALEEIGAYEDYMSLDDQEMRGILWGQLGSKVRTALRRIQDEANRKATS